MKTRFVIFSQGRSGSTLLKHLLNSHPDICCEGELLNPADQYLRYRWQVNFIRRFPYPYFSYREMAADKPCYGFTLLYYQYYPQEKILWNLHKRSWKIIYLRRLDVIAQSFSYLVAKKTEKWHHFEDTGARAPTLRLDRDEFVDWTRKMQVINQQTDLFMASIPHLLVTYENDQQSEAKWPQTTGKIFTLLRIRQAPAIATLQKTYFKPYSEIVENYTELITALSSVGTP